LKKVFRLRDKKITQRFHIFFQVKGQAHHLLSHSPEFANEIKAKKEKPQNEVSIPVREL
jgi:hypothetical protein